MEVIKVVEVKTKGDPRKNRSQDGPVPEKDQIQGRFYCDKCSKSYKEQKALHDIKRNGAALKKRNSNVESVKRIFSRRRTSGTPRSKT